MGKYYYYPVAVAIIIVAFVILLFRFENKRVKAREVVLIASLCALAVVGRAACFMLPNFKPVTAIIMLSGITLGPQYGFLIGTMSGFVSNFLFGQGSWTLWQMTAWGFVGLISGIVFSGKRRKYADKLWFLLIYGFVITVFGYGVIVDTEMLLFMVGNLNLESILGVYVAGFPFNVVHGVSTVVFTLLMAKVFFKQMERIKNKYGIR